MAWIEIVLPGGLLFYKIFLKLVIGKSCTLPDFINASLALPVDIAFLSASLLTAHIITNPTTSRQALIYFLFCLILATIAVWMWRRSEEQFVRDKYITATLVGVLNGVVAAVVLFLTVTLLSAGGKP